MIEFQDASYLMRVSQVGVYLLSFEGIVVYVGKSVNIPTRVREHVKSNRMQFDKVFVKYCRVVDLDDLEYNTIRKYRPKYNIVYNHDIPVFEPFDLAAFGLVREPTIPRVPKQLLGGNSPPRAKVVWVPSLKGRKGY